MLGLQETLMLEQNLYVSLLGSVWRKVCPQHAHDIHEEEVIWHDFCACNFANAGASSHVQATVCCWAQVAFGMCARPGLVRLHSPAMPMPCVLLSRWCSSLEETLHINVPHQ